MKNIYFLFTYFFILQNIIGQVQPDSQKKPSQFTKHNIIIDDDYSWLENTNSDEVVRWVNEQNNFSENHLKDVTKATNFLFKIKDYDYLSTNGLPIKKGKYFYSLYRLDKKKPSVLHYRKELNDSPLELVDPYKVYKDKNVLLNGYYPSENSKYLAYKISPNGSDRHEIRFVDIANQKYLDEVLKDIKFSNVVWNNDDGVFYKKNSNQNFFTKDSTYQLYYHKLRDIQEKDRLVFDTTNDESNFSFFVRENKLFVFETNKEESNTKYHYIDLTDETFTLNEFSVNKVDDFSFLYFKDDRVYFTNTKYDWGDIRSFNINDSNKETSIIPQIYTHLLVDIDFTNDYIICKYRNLGNNYINIHKYDGSFVRKFEAPMEMDFSIRFLDSKTNELYVTFYSNTISYLNYRLNITTGDTNVYYNYFIQPKPTLFPFDHFENKTITYKSRDGKDVPITIIHKKGIELNGNNPTLLKAYGGFGSVSGPNYNVGLLHFLEKGGVYAFAQIRGGGEKGRKWHRDGKGLKKMNSFNDFIDAAEFLINEKYTSSNKLAITGGSNGGLVVGVAMTQRPDLFKVAVPKVGVFDMAKFDQYTTGKYHLDEYGNPEVEEEYKSLLSYSPYHNIKEDINYPITLIITSENDDRVPPIHSYKFAAKLQNRKAQTNPIYLQINSNAGHYGKISNYENSVKNLDEFYSFIWEHLNE
ncbi:prolyl oligopeptidase family serine peptidase [Flavobacterium jumunjinense]|uniref:Prolyl oligopeptidase family serine peptidase n=1 Tax=Flavobacterium jumunjinense TaxID=998845 RepID=A0ABV5GRC1_9FLAO|nr:prolyl oligopeptidase family serine peptidase [Flavobacterium jumunjinense]